MPELWAENSLGRWNDLFEIYNLLKSVLHHCIMKSVLITGATGFIGRHVVTEALARKYHVRALVRASSSGKTEIEALGVEIALGDMTDFSSLQSACSGINIVFHCAGIVTDWAPRELYDQVNIQGMENLCRAALGAKVDRLVYMSTNDVFGPVEDVVIDETFPVNSHAWKEPYPDTKIEADKIAWRYHHEHGLPVSMVYACWVYGKGDTTFIPLTADAILKKDMIFWRKDAHTWPNYIDNLMDLMFLLAEHPAAIGNGYLSHDGEMVTFQDLCRDLAIALDVKPITTHIPYFLAMMAGKLMEFWWKLTKKKTRPLITTYTVKNLGSRLNFSIEKAERELGWTPKISYQEGMKRTIEWLKTLDLDDLKQK
ncbi:MAG: NAD-dependent epimerase/dehydratase family protein [Promethearchaeota archaeon]|nr:MAG: NAD-dependent epimerase/dehydratase family protein [Candidatus Lokiarchaeota archaeon]